MRTLPSTDVLIVGGGFTGLYMAKELGSRTPVSVVVLERGEQRGISEYLHGMDELDYFIHKRMMQNYALETATFRHSEGDRALPLRRPACFLPGTGVGGAGEHWGTAFDRMVPDGFELYSKTVEKYGEKKLPLDHSIQDWGVTYDEMEPYYTRVEVLLGISGKAGNIRGKLIEGGNVFEGWRSTEYPTPPLKTAYFCSLFRDAAKSLGYHPYPFPVAALSTPYTNPDGVSRPGCTYCGYCGQYGCMIGAKAQPSNTFLPVINRYKHVSIRTGASVRRIVHDDSQNASKARGVTYIDARGEEIFQPADLVILTSWTLNNTKLLLLSGVGEPYNPSTGKGNVGRNLTHQAGGGGVRVLLEKPLNRFMGSGGTQFHLDDFAGHVLDHTNLPFLRGGSMGASSIGYGPIEAFGTVPRSVKARWGSEWKKAAIDCYDRVAGIGFSCEHLAYRDHYLDLDPTYKDHYGDPLIRLTLDWKENERQQAAFGATKALEIARAMGAKEITAAPPLGHYDTRQYHSTHINGGAIMGKLPDRSVVNPYLQHWQLSNLFVVGASAFPQNSAMHPTPTILALTLRTADAIVDRYLKTPGALA
jgi:gluconate 2-dehydrogenase alpha chain